MLKQQDWINLISKKINCTKKEAKEYYDCIFDYIKEQISPDDSVKIAGFGVFKLRKTAAKEQVNLSTGKTEIIPEHYVLTFKPYFELEAKPNSIAISDQEELEFVDSNEEDFEEIEIIEDAQIEEETKNLITIKQELNNFSWIYLDKTYDTKNIIQILIEKTSLEKNDIISSIEIIAKNIQEISPECKQITIIDNGETFDFKFN